jgi:hypothetical protein
MRRRSPRVREIDVGAAPAPKASAADRRRFWVTFVRALEVEPIEARAFVGASGLEHRAVAAGYDHSRRRLLLISSEPSGRVAALAQGDVQSAHRDVKVVVARPITVNLAGVARLFTDSIGTVRIGQKQLQMARDKPDAYKRAMERLLRRQLPRLKQLLFQANEIADLNVLVIWQEVMEQIALVDFAANPDLPDAKKQVDRDLELGRLIALDPAEHDRRQGICSIPLYDFTPGEATSFHRGADIEAARDALRRLQVLQYFFPAPDHVALGLIHHSPQTSSAAAATVARLPDLGHPLGPAELVDPSGELLAQVDGLRERGFIVQGEIGLEITDAGRSVRRSVRFTPREGLFAKISHVLQIKIDLTLRDLFRSAG